MIGERIPGLADAESARRCVLAWPGCVYRRWVSKGSGWGNRKSSRCSMCERRGCEPNRKRKRGNGSERDDRRPGFESCSACWLSGTQRGTSLISSCRCLSGSPMTWMRAPSHIGLESNLPCACHCETGSRGPPFVHAGQPKEAIRVAESIVCQYFGENTVNSRIEMESISKELKSGPTDSHSRGQGASRPCKPEASGGPRSPAARATSVGKSRNQ